MHIIWPATLIGVGAIVAGTLSIIFRVRLADFQTQQAQTMWGSWKGTRKPWMVATVGVIFVLGGTYYVLLGLRVL